MSDMDELGKKRQEKAIDDIAGEGAGKALATTSEIEDAILKRLALGEPGTSNLRGTLFVAGILVGQLTSFGVTKDELLNLFGQLMTDLGKLVK
jgi:hypothetical protein